MTHTSESKNENRLTSTPYPPPTHITLPIIFSSWRLKYLGVSVGTCVSVERERETERRVSVLITILTCPRHGFYRLGLKP